jgi:hypothetical protein
MIGEYEPERLWNKAEIAHLTVLSRHLPGGTDEPQDKSQSGKQKSLGDSNRAPPNKK